MGSCKLPLVIQYRVDCDGVKLYVWKISNTCLMT